MMLWDYVGVMTRPEVRTLRDAAPLAALAHPFRSRMMDALKVDGPSTASMLAARTGQAVGNASHHLKVLAAAGLVEEAPELARDRRERWWRLVSTGTRWSRRDLVDQAAVTAAQEAEALGARRQQERLRDWMANADTDPEWEDAAFATQNWLRLSPAELQQLSDEVVEVLTRWGNREVPGRRRPPRAGPRLRPGLPEPAVSVDTDRPGRRSADRRQRQLPAALVRRGRVGARLDDHGGGRPARRRHRLRRGRCLDGSAHRRGLAPLARRRPAGRARGSTAPTRAG